MKPMYMILPLAILLTACGSNPIKKLTPEPVIITQYKYIVISVPEEILEKPESISTPDPETATDRDVAEWLLDKEGRSRKMENSLDSAKTYQKERLELLKTQKGIKSEDIIE